MKLAVRFRYYKAVAPSMDIVELTDEQWREFFLLEKVEDRMKFMKRFLGRSMDSDIKEMWWIPLDGQKQLSVSKKAEVISRASMQQTHEEIMREAIMAAEETKRTMEEHRAWLDEHYKKAEQRLEKLKAEFRKEGYKID